MSGRPITSERGAGSILVLCAVAVVLTVSFAVITLAGGYDARHRAATAADLAALAAAGRARSGAPSACAFARTVAEANGGVLKSCELVGWQVVVSVAAQTTGPSAWLPDPVRRARAGPAPGARVMAGGLDPAAGLRAPVGGDYRITARFGDAGPRWASGRHGGLDFAAEPGSPVLAAAGGRVVTVGPAGRYGNLVAIDHGGMVTYYAHLSAATVAVGDVVVAGQLVGTVGSTGNATGPHLHLEVRIDGVAQDPAAFLQSRSLSP
jgi:secretion/DNA translocation related TadE-like protein